MTAITLFLKRRKHRQPESHSSTAGFTIIEMMAVVAIVGILAAMVGVSYLGWIARLRVNAAQDVALQAIRQAQTTAKQKSFPWQASFRQDGDKVQWAVHSKGAVPSDTTWNTISEPDVILTAASWDVKFNHKGQVEGDMPDTPLTVSNKSGGNKRCVIVKTILGALQTASDSQCN